MNIRRICVLVAACLFCIESAYTAKLNRRTIEAFDQYVQAAEGRLQQRVDGRKGFLWVDDSSEKRSRVRQGRILTQPWNGTEEIEAPDGLIHDWIGAIFVPGATLKKTLTLVQDYNRHKSIYPEVIDSKLLDHDGDHYKVYLRLLKKKVLTVVLDTEHDVRYFPLNGKRCYSRSHSTRIAEVENARNASETELPVGDDHGFLWRLYSYWRFEERDGGVYIECEAITLTRDIPAGLGWIIEPIIRNLPRESLAGTLAATRAALSK
jgi:hypothetical protein